MNHLKIDKENNRLDFTDQRFYFDEDGMWWPSVTTVLDCYPKSAHFFEWLKQNGQDADRIRDEAAGDGSAVHFLTERYDNGETVSILDPYDKAQYSSKVWSQFERYVEFSRRFKPDVLYNELTLVDKEMGLGGTLDRIVQFPDNMDVVGGKKYLLDIKTGNSVYSHYWIQLNVYRKMFERKFGEELDGVAVLWLNAKTKTEGKKGTIQGNGWQMCFPEKEHEHYIKLFDCVYTLYREENTDAKPRNISYNIRHTKLKMA